MEPKNVVFKGSGTTVAPARRVDVLSDEFWTAPPSFDDFEEAAEFYGFGLSSPQVGEVHAATAFLTEDTVALSGGGEATLIDAAVAPRDTGCFPVRIIGVDEETDVPVASFAWHLALQAYERNAPVSGVAVGRRRGALILDVPEVGLRATLPHPPAGDLTGRTFEGLVTHCDPETGTFVVSRNKLLHSRKKYVRGLVAGEVLRQVRVVGVTGFGAFVELPEYGANGLVPLSELVWERIKVPADVVAVGDLLDVQVLSVERGRSKDKVTLSSKRLLPDPAELLWVAAAASIRAGQQVPATVSRVVDELGVFVRLDEYGIDGLVHVSQLVGEPAVGDVLSPRVLWVNAERRRVGLSLKPAGNGKRKRRK